MINQVPDLGWQEQPIGTPGAPCDAVVFAFAPMLYGCTQEQAGLTRAITRWRPTDDERALLLAGEDVYVVTYTQDTVNLHEVCVGGGALAQGPAIRHEPPIAVR